MNNKNKIVIPKSWMIIILIISIEIMLVSYLGTNAILRKIAGKTQNYLLSEVEPKELGEDADSWKLKTMFIERDDDGTETQTDDITWNAIDYNESKIITVQINYSNTNTKQAYAPGELKIVVPNLGKTKYWYHNYNGEEVKDVVYYIADEISASDPYSEEEKEKWNWSYEYDALNEVCVFTNNEEIEAGTSCEGSIQMSYNFNNMNSMINGTDLNIKATLNNEAESNNIHFAFTSKKDTFYSEVSTYKISNYEGLPENATEYVWVKYNFCVNRQIDGIRCRINEPTLKIDIPKNSILVNKNFEEVIANNGKYILPIEIPYTSNYFYIGYLESEYKDKQIENTFEVYGEYGDYDSDRDFTGEQELLTNKEITININDFLIDTNNLYEITQSDNYFYCAGSYQNIKDGLARYYFGIKPKINYVDGKITARIGNDVLAITAEDGSYRKLEDDEYYFAKIIVPVFRNLNDNEIPEGKYTYSIFVRYANEENYVLYEKNLKNTKSEQTISFTEENIVGWYIEIYDLEESCKLSRDSYIDSLESHLKIHVQDNITNSGKIYNWAYLQAYKKDSNGELVLQNERDLEKQPYSEIEKQIDLPNYDKKYYRVNLQRTFLSYDYTENRLLGSCNSEIQNIKVKDGDFYIKTDLITYIENARFGSHIFTEFNGWKNCYIFDKEIELDMTEEEIKNSIRGYNWDKVLKNNKTTFKSEEEFNEFIKDCVTVKIDRNYKNIGKNYVEIIYDFREVPLDLSNFMNDCYNGDLGIYIYFNLKVSYEDYKMNRNIYSYNIYTMNLDDDDSYELKYSNKDYEDIDEDGDITEMIESSSQSITLVYAGETKQELQMSMQTVSTNNKYVIENALTYKDYPYSYKLRVTAGPNDLTNVVVYNEIETEGEGWKGSFQGVDTSVAESQGYNVKVYYSEITGNGSIKDDPNWKEYIEGVTDKTKVKAIAFDYGNSIIKSGNVTYVLINMRGNSQDEVEGVYAQNRCHIEWSPIDILGNVIGDAQGIQSNTTEIGFATGTKNYDVTLQWPEELEKPENVTINLIRDGEIVKTIELNEEDEWKGVFEENEIYTVIDGSLTESDYKIQIIENSGGDASDNEYFYNVEEEKEKDGFIIEAYGNATKELSYKVQYISLEDGKEQIKEEIVKSKTVNSSEPNTLKFDRTLVNSIYEGYEIKRTEPQTIASTVNNGDIIKVYLDKIDCDVIIKYIDNNRGWNEQIADTVTITKKYGETVDLSEYSKEIEGYQLIEAPEEKIITLAEKEKEYIFYYAKNTSFIVRLRDAVSSKILFKTDLIPVVVGQKCNINIENDKIIVIIEGTKYEYPIGESLKGYRLFNSSAPSEQTIYYGENTYDFYYIREASLSIYQMDAEEEGRTFEEKHIIGSVGDDFYTEAINIKNKVLVGMVIGEIIDNNPETKEGIFAGIRDGKLVYCNQETGETVEQPSSYSGKLSENQTIVIYYYAGIEESEEKGVIVKCVDVDTGGLINNDLIIGNVGDTYETSPIDLKGYKLVEDKLPENANGQIAEDVTEVIYYYKSVRTSSVVGVYINQETGAELEREMLAEGVVGKEYKLNPKNSITIDGTEYVLITERMPDDIKGTLEPNEKEVKFYYAEKSKGVTKKVIDKTTGEVIKTISSSDEPGNDYVGKQVDNLPPVIPGYDLVSAPNVEDIPQKMTKEEIVLEYYYIKKVTITVKYVDINTGNVLLEYNSIKNENVESTIQITNKHQNDTYEAKPKIFKGYVLVERPEEETITLGTEDVVLTYKYGRESKGVVLVICDYETKQPIDRIVFKDESIEDYEGKTYVVTIPEVDGYELVTDMLPENSEGKMTTELIKVKYYYKKKQAEEEIKEDISNNVTGTGGENNINNNNITVAGSINGNSLPNTGDKKFFIAMLAIINVILGNIMQIGFSKNNKKK
ncbi:MAG: MucBP domain-containing protein [Candidatus Scatovivens sp.]